MKTNSSVGFPWENIFTISSRRPHGCPCLGLPAETLSQQAAWDWSTSLPSGGDLSLSLSGAWGRFLQSQEGGTTFSFHPHPHCISQHPLLTRGYDLKCLQGQTGNIHEQSKRWYGAIGTGGACGKLKSKVSSSKGQSWPMVAKQIGKDGDPVLPNLLTYQKKPPFFIYLFFHFLF